MRFDDVASTDIVRPIVTLTRMCGKNGLDQRPRLVLVEDDNSIDSAQCGRTRRAIALCIDRPARTFNPKHRGIAVQTNNQGITLRPRKLEVLNMAAV